MTKAPGDIFPRQDPMGSDASLAIHPSADGGLATWNKAAFSDLRAVVGAQKADQIALLFHRDLSKRFVDPDNHGQNQRDAHVIASTAGMLGFDHLSNVAKALETAYLRDVDPLPTLADLMTVRRSAIHALSAGHSEPPGQNEEPA